MSHKNTVQIQVVRRHTYFEETATQSEASRAWNLRLLRKRKREPWRGTLELLRSVGTSPITLSFARNVGSVMAEMGKDSEPIFIRSATKRDAADFRATDPSARRLIRVAQYSPFEVADRTALYVCTCFARGARSMGHAAQQWNGPGESALAVKGDLNGSTCWR